jgi:hypothetical protein
MAVQGGKGALVVFCGCGRQYIKKAKEKEQCGATKHAFALCAVCCHGGKVLKTHPIHNLISATPNDD